MEAFFFGLILKPIAAFFVLLPIYAGRWWVCERMQDGRLKRLLLSRIG